MFMAIARASGVRSVGRAVLLSILIPGLGQIYEGSEHVAWGYYFLYSLRPLWWLGTGSGYGLSHLWWYGFGVFGM